MVEHLCSMGKAPGSIPNPQEEEEEVFVQEEDSPGFVSGVIGFGDRNL